MATVSTLSFAEKVALPFCVVVPVGVGIIGYFIWKRDTSSLSSSSSLSKDHYVNADSTVSSDEVDVMETVNTSAGGMNRKMAMWFMASCAAMIGLALFHVVRNLMAATDYRIGMLGFGGALVVAMCAAMFSVTLRITDEADLFLNKRYEVADFVQLDSHTVEEIGPIIPLIQRSIRQRYIVSALVYLNIVFQSAFDGLVLKYNPNAQESATQVAMFYLTKLPESIVVSTVLIHAAVRTKWYCVYMFNFTATVGLSTIAAYGTVNPLLIVAVYEHWLFQIILGASGGLLLALSFYFFHLESRRALIIDGSGSNVWLNVIAFVSTFAICCATGMFG